ncbi:hypothetical protein J1614_010472 [Plenodomus biglobosus]|nr:hypothetical protein J1614_010472 [Plenodomus biglobosus]
MPSLSRFLKYALLAFVAILTIALWRREYLPRTSVIHTAITADSLPVSEAPLPRPRLGISSTQGDEEDDDDTFEASSELHSKVDSKPDPSSSPKSVPSTFSTSLAKPAFAKFAKITASFGEPDPPYEAAIASHNLHNELHGYRHFILREQMLQGLWSKHAYILSIIGNELVKPVKERLEWVMWHDRDTLLMNPQIPLNIFVPPSPAFDHIHLLVTNDRHGLNNGVFFCRVSAASFKFFANALSFKEYEPDVQLKYTEQSGMEEVIKRENWNGAVAYIPQRWFNGFPPTKRSLKQGKPSSARPGSLLIHFASNRDGLRPQRMASWEEIAKSRSSEWDKPVEETGYLREIAEYWERLGKGESQERIIKDIEVRVWE